MCRPNRMAVQRTRGMFKKGKHFIRKLTESNRIAALKPPPPTIPEALFWFSNQPDLLNAFDLAGEGEKEAACLSPRATLRARGKSMTFTCQIPAREEGGWERGGSAEVDWRAPLPVPPLSRNVICACPSFPASCLPSQKLRELQGREEESASALIYEEASRGSPDPGGQQWRGWWRCRVSRQACRRLGMPSSPDGPVILLGLLQGGCLRVPPPDPSFLLLLVPPSSSHVHSAATPRDVISHQAAVQSAPRPVKPTLPWAARGTGGGSSSSKLWESPPSFLFPPLQQLAFLMGSGGGSSHLLSLSATLSLRGTAVMQELKVHRSGGGSSTRLPCCRMCSGALSLFPGRTAA